MYYNYITTTKGIGGRIKQFCEDFIVEEIGRDYSTKVSYLLDNSFPENDWDKVFESKGDNEQLYLDMEKLNLSTTSAINLVSRRLRFSRKRVGYAGLKDKRAITAQRISIYEPTKEGLAKASFKNIRLYNPSWANERIDIGSLTQNRFTVTVRQITGFTKEELQELFHEFYREIEQTGFINYFGEQRFGGQRDITHKLGKLILKRDYKSAILLYLTQPSNCESQELLQVRRQIKEDMDFGRHARAFPSSSGFESQILNYLASHPDDYLGAFKVLPKSIQYLFVHAYQSYLFNEIINERIKRGFGLQAIDGDTLVDGKVAIPLFGFASHLSNGTAGEIEQEILCREGINLCDFFNKDHHVFSTKGDYRLMTVPVYDLKLLEIADDCKNQDVLSSPLCIKFSFVLDKGNYASTLARELIKPSDQKWC